MRGQISERLDEKDIEMDSKFVLWRCHGRQRGRCCRCDFCGATDGLRLGNKKVEDGAMQQLMNFTSLCIHKLLYISLTTLYASVLILYNR
jgi:hypothetical protein